MINIPNTLTISRIFVALFLLLTVPFSVPFYMLYIYCGISDILDGYLARKLNCISNTGAFLDTCADLSFTLVITIKLLPILIDLLSKKLILWIIIMAVIRIIIIIVGFIKFRTLCFLHTYLNKLTGLVVFIAMLFLNKPFSLMMIYTICIIANIAALEELLILIRSSILNRDIKKY